MDTQTKSERHDFVSWFRESSPYIKAFRQRTFVVAFGGEMLADAQFSSLVHDLALLNSLGVRLVLVYGTRPQIEQCLKQHKGRMRYEHGLRITDDTALACVKQAAGSVRVDIEAMLSTGLSNSPMAGANIRVVSGNFVTAQPLGIRHGVDYCHTGEVRRIDRHAIQLHLSEGALVLLSPLGYSPSGEVFNLSMQDVATAAAIQLQADKLIYLVDGKGITDNRRHLLRELTLPQAEKLLAGKHKLNPDAANALQSTVTACRHEVPRCHILSRQVDGALLLELFSRDGCGTLIMQDPFEDTRQASLADIGGILALIQPLETDDILVRRSRERLEMEIDHFTVVERDGMIIGCAALYPFIQERISELACLAIHPDYRNQGRGDGLLRYVERQSKQLGIQQLFVLTTRTSHWFRERGFRSGNLESLPVKRRDLYNYQRKSRVYIKDIA
jgi:amino-acid N-acetyltransferase